MKEISFEGFSKKFLFSRDHLHLSAVISEGSKWFDPIILHENKDIPGRHSNKFPGASFDKKYLAPGFLTKSIEHELKDLGFSKNQYRFWIDFYKTQDRILESNTESFIKNEYLFFMKKVLVLSVLKKTGLFVELSEEPFYIDSYISTESKDLVVYRIFFEAVRFQKPEIKTKRFFNLFGHTQRLNEFDYNQIVEIVQKKLDPKPKLKCRLLLSYWVPLVRYLKGV